MSENNSTTLWDVPPEKRCAKCRKFKTLDNFGKVRGKIRSYCRDCHREANFIVDLRTEKNCAKCKTVKSTEFFGRLGNRFQPYCKTCCSELSRQRNNRLAESGDAKKVNREDYIRRAKWARLLKKYGLDRKSYEEMELLQNYRCAVCEQPETAIYQGTVLKFTVDHDHSNGKVRGLLCRSCNMVLGKFNEDIWRFRKAIEYLEKTKKE